MPLSQCAHEGRTALAILQARLDGLPDTDPELRQEIREDIAAIMRVMDQTVALMRVQTEAMPVAPVDLVTIAREVLAGCAARAFERALDVSFVAAYPAVIVDGHRGFIALAFRQLIDNAIAETPHGHAVTVTVAEGAVLTVANDGPLPAIPTQDGFFVPFWHGRNQDRRGAGLGLAIAQTVAIRHGGTLSCDVSPSSTAQEAQTIFVLRL